ncbi:nucleotidyltransferase family protein [Pantoea sp. Mb-10]|uniref:nucleotidyltransferase family protein n=1 Tax=unclassified Pantoea TaxID=2630326 RepID=UPI001E472539|nr:MULTISPECIES: nucleotidyltransferase family protein [unclassified Pantoea]MCE0491866.1 nucleotidyltransferase family protein [Pantoea sp. Mb-10]MCE0503396.1 nucleotidyltransferase family protein [Pantoea sp. Pb-8]
MKHAILIMAAGLSERYRHCGQGHKLTALLWGKPILQHTLARAVATGLDVFVMTRPEDHTIHALLPPPCILTCTSGGLGDSIAAAVGAVPDYDGWLIALGDMPLIAPASYLAVSEALRSAPMARAVVDGEPAHPVGFDRSYFLPLRALRGDTGARALLHTSALRRVDLHDSGCRWDVDTPDDLRTIAALTRE